MCCDEKKSHVSSVTAVDHSCQHSKLPADAGFFFPPIFKTVVYVFSDFLVPKLKVSPLYIASGSNMINGPWCGGEKEHQAFSATLVFEVKILWTGPKSIFPQLKVHTLPSPK